MRLSMQHLGQLLWSLLFCSQALFAVELPLNQTGASELDRYTVESVRERLPQRRHGSDVSLIRLDQLYTFPVENYFELQTTRQHQGKRGAVKAIMLANGVYDLADVVRLVNDDRLIRQVDAKTYISYRPIYVAPTAKLVVQGVTLRLSVPDTAVLAYNGDLYVVDATITSWDESRGDYGPRPVLPKAELLHYAKRDARPYIQGMEGSGSYFANSTINGLGYNGRASFGLSLTAPQIKSLWTVSSLSGAIKYLPKPHGIFVGNRIVNCFFGFYTNDADRVVLIGNIFHDNLIYNVDPHDFTKRLIVARNITFDAKHAHGIILSREIKDALISENISFGNHGSGIMLDRNIERTLIRDNVVFANHGDGVAIFESDNNRISGNTLFSNANNGLFVRNSLSVTADNNRFFRNGHFGVETAVVNIDKLETRDFERDPYHMASGLRLNRNTLSENLSGAVAIKSSAYLQLFGNDFSSSGSSLFSDDVQGVADQLLLGNLQGGVSFCGDPKRLCSGQQFGGQSKLHRQKRAGGAVKPSRQGDINRYKREILEQLAQEGVVAASYELSVLQLRELSVANKQSIKRITDALSQSAESGHSSSLRLLAHLKLREHGYRGERVVGPLTKLALAALHGDAKAAIELKWLPLITGVSKNQLVSAVNRARAELVAADLCVGDECSSEQRPAAQSNEPEKLRSYRAVLRLFKPEIDRFQAYGPDKLKEYLSEQKAINRLKVKREARRQRELLEGREATGERRAYLDRKAMRERTSDRYLIATRAEDMQRHKERLEQVLGKVNRHRDPGARVSYTQLSRWAGVER